MEKGETGAGKKTDPRVQAIVLLTLLLIAAAVALRLWASDQRLAVPAIKGMTVAPDGRAFIVVGNTLYIESATGESLRVLPLEDWGINAFHGDLAVLQDGSVILAEGNLGGVGLAEGLRMYGRQRPAGSDPAEGLKRCYPAEDTCTPLAGAGVPEAFRRAFSIDVDGTAGLIYLSEPGRHRIVQMTLAGERLAVSDDGWQFPNGLHVVAPGRVGFVDTNHHRYVELAAGKDGFEGAVHEESILGWPGVNLSHRFPFEAVKDGNGVLWMLVADLAMKDAWLYRYPEGGPAERIRVPDAVDPIDLAVTRYGVLVADARSFRIHHFNAAGEIQGDFGSGTLRNHLAALASQFTRYTQLFDYSLLGVLLIAVPALGIGLYVQYRTPRPDAARKEIDVTATDEPLPEFRNVEAQFASLHGEFTFWRKLTVLGTRESFRFGALVTLLFAILVVTTIQLMRGIAEREGRPLADVIMESPMPLMLAITAVALLLIWSSAMFERIIITRDGMRYISWMPGPLGNIIPFHGNWFLRWSEIESVKLVHVGTGRNQLMWRYQVVAKDGRRKRIHPLSWRLAGEPETGISLKDAFRQDPRMIRDVIQRTRLFRLLGQQWQAKTAEAVADAG